MDIKWFFADVAVADYTSARTWYERLMGRPPDFNPHENEAVWQIIDNGWIYVVADTDRAGKALLTLMVDNLDRQVAELKERGIAVGAIETQPGLFRRAEVTDPEETRSPSAKLSAQATTDEAGPQTFCDKTALAMLRPSRPAPPALAYTAGTSSIVLTDRRTQTYGQTASRC